ncbi:MAG TPA: CcdB family protein [Rhizomicrobium sp.]|jgi:hypothetical protein|nr:CcdB family protein [Rhizomicrobium sp.]
MAQTRSTIRQFDVVANPLRAQRADKPYLVCIQHGLLGHLSSRIVAPLVTSQIIREPSRLHPSIAVGAAKLFFDPTDLLTLPIRLLKAPVANVEGERDRIVAALDLVFTGI